MKLLIHSQTATVAPSHILLGMRLFWKLNHVSNRSPLTHWGRVTHICVGKLIIIGSDNGLSPGQRQAIIWNIAGLLLIEPLGTNFSEISIGIQTFSFKKIHLKMSSGKWRPFCLGLNVLRISVNWSHESITVTIWSQQTKQDTTMYIWVRSRNCGCLVTWFCYQLSRNCGCLVTWFCYQLSRNCGCLVTCFCYQLSRNCGCLVTWFCYQLSRNCGCLVTWFCYQLSRNCGCLVTWFCYQLSRNCGCLVTWFCYQLSRNCGCLVTWFCYQLIAKPGNKTATVSWPDTYLTEQALDVQHDKYNSYGFIVSTSYI